MAKLHDRRAFIVVAVLLLLSVAGYLYIRFVNTNKGVIGPTGGLPDLAGMEPQVAEKIRTLNHLVERQPKSADAWGRLAMTLDVHGLKEDSLARYERAAQLAPQDFRWPYYCAISLKEKGSVQSLSWFAKAEAVNTSYLPLEIRYGRALLDFGRIEEARERFVQALKINPRSAEAYVGLGQVAISHGDAQVAKEVATKAIALKPDLTEAYHLFALACRKSGDTECAEEAIEKAKNLPDKNALIDPTYAALASEGVSAFWYRTRGRAYMESGLYDLAYQQFLTALKLHPDAEAYDNLGVALQGLRRWPEAIESHKKSIAMNPNYLNYFNLGIAYAKLGELPAAIAALQRSLEFKSDNPDCLYNLGVAFYKQSRHAEAIDALNKAIRIRPSYSEAHFALGMCYLAEGEQQKAKAEYDLLLKLNPVLAGRFLNAQK